MRRNSPGVRVPRWMLFAALAATVFVAGCAAEPEDPASGTCTLSCSQPRSGAHEYEVELMWSEQDPEIGLTCLVSGNQLEPHNVPLQVRFMVYEKVKPFTPGKAEGGEGEGGAAGGQAGLQGGAILDRIPRGGIGFEPWLYGQMSVANTNEEFKSNETTVSSARYAGVVTPSSEWCSDSCGVMTYEFWPMCIPGGDNQIEAAVAVQGAKLTAKYRFNLGNDQD